MKDINQVTLSGQICFDPKKGVTSKGTAWCRGVVETQRDFDKKDGEVCTEKGRFDFVAYGEEAKWMASLLTEGTKVVLFGTLRTELPDRQEANEHFYRVVLVAWKCIAQPN